MMGFDLYQTITDRIIAELERGTLPWQRPWNSPTGAISHVTGKPYSVLNQLMLPQTGEYVTFKQALVEGHPVRKGEKSHMVFFFKIVENKDRDTGATTSVPFLRYYSVFHISQCDGMKPRFAVSVQNDQQLQPDARAEQIIHDYVQRSGVKLTITNSSQAYYQPSTDQIVVPELQQYACASEYLSTVAHECVHSTGHPTRLNRITNMAAFGSETYCYPGGDVLKNKLNITDSELLEYAERKLTAIRISELLHRRIGGQFDFAHLKAIHFFYFSGFIILLT